MRPHVRVCGISFDSTDSILAIVDFDAEGGCEFVLSETKRIGLGDHENETCLQAFQRLLTAIVKDNKIDAIAIRKCTYSGKYPSGAASVKMEAILQLADIKTVLLDSRSITAICGKNKCSIPPQVNKYQHDAFKAAFALAHAES